MFVFVFGFVIDFELFGVVYDFVVLDDEVWVVIVSFGCSNLVFVVFVFLFKDYEEYFFGDWFVCYVVEVV